MWKFKPCTMLKKVCISQAFRMFFPEELGGFPYIQDELGTKSFKIISDNNQNPEPEKVIQRGSKKTDNPEIKRISNKDQNISLNKKREIIFSNPLFKQKKFSEFLFNQKWIKKGGTIKNLSDAKINKFYANLNKLILVFSEWKAKNK